MSLLAYFCYRNLTSSFASSQASECLFYLCPYHRCLPLPIPSFPPSLLLMLSLFLLSTFLLLSLPSSHPPSIHLFVHPCSCLSIRLSLPHTALFLTVILPVLPIVIVLISRGMSKGAYLSVSSTLKDSSTSSEASFSIVISTQCSWLLSANETILLMPIKSIPPVEKTTLHPKMQGFI